ncbi:AraC family transcriptional regulator of arabinose operon [Microbacterium sp. ZKA21]|jgi:AraC family transcriptional regulator of arabinose operon|uniref:AraC family transcriptional regulator n=1 Tax=Microbacterium sp. ZKA21 TaxID=3381694 RepID=UPI003D1A4BAB
MATPQSPLTSVQALAPDVVDAPQRFRGERFLVVPRGEARAVLDGPASPGVAVTDCGYFPHADRHFRVRNAAISELIVIACQNGTGWYDTGSGPAPIVPGQILLVPPGQIHAYGASADDPWTVWWVHVAGVALSEFLSRHGVAGAEPVRTPSSFFQITALIAQIVTTLEVDMTEISQLRAAGTAWHLLTTIVTDKPVAKGMDQVLDDAAAAIRTRVQDKASTEDFAAAANVSVSHFAAQFRRRFGVSVGTYQRQIRMARARELFDLGTGTVGEVAREVGYDDPLYFSRQFTRTHGVSPRAYKDGDRGAPVARHPDPSA